MVEFVVVNSIVVVVVVVKCVCAMFKILFYYEVNVESPQTAMFTHESFKVSKVPYICEDDSGPVLVSSSRCAHTYMLHSHRSWRESRFAVDGAT